MPQKEQTPAENNFHTFDAFFLVRVQLRAGRPGFDSWQGK
jgi:hypothetical protein